MLKTLHTAGTGFNACTILYAISLDWLCLDVRLPVVANKTGLAGCSKLAHVKQAVLMDERSICLMAIFMLMIKTL